MVSLVSSVSLVNFLLQLHRTSYYLYMEQTEETKETNIYPPSLKTLHGGDQGDLLRLLGLLRQDFLGAHK